MAAISSVPRFSHSSCIPRFSARSQSCGFCSRYAACGACVDACPRSVIKLLRVSQNVIVRCRNEETARAARESCMRACIACGRCKRECKYDAIIIENGYARIDHEKCTRCGDCAKVCPCNCITVE